MITKKICILDNNQISKLFKKQDFFGLITIFCFLFKSKLNSSKELQLDLPLAN